MHFRRRIRTAVFILMGRREATQQVSAISRADALMKSGNMLGARNAWRAAQAQIQKLGNPYDHEMIACCLEQKPGPASA